MKRTGFIAALCLFAAGGAHAHTNYMRPSAFAPGGEVVTVESSFAEHFFEPEVPVLSDDYHVLRPDGRREAFDTVAPHRQLTLLETDIAEPGTYRLTTGVRLGRVSTAIFTGGQWRPLRENETAPRGARVERSQTETVADVYVTKGAPTRTVVDREIGRLIIHPITHPSEIFAADGFDLEVKFDGAPLANQEIVVSRANGIGPADRTLTTDASGRLHISFEQPGAYVLMTRRRADAPPGSTTEIRSYTTTLTFEVSP